MSGRGSERRGEAAAAGLARPGSRHEGGAAIAEFAVMALALWLLLAGMLELGRAYAAQQLLQNAAASAARDLSLREAPADLRFLSGAGGAPSARDAIFDERFLVADAPLLAACLTSTPPQPGLSLRNVRRYLEEQNAPVLNRLLLPLWIRDVVDGREVLRYPGAVLRRTNAAGGCSEGTGYTVQIPELQAGGGVQWHQVVEPLRMGGGPLDDPFPLANGGWASIRVRYPFQASGLQGWRTTPGGGQQMIDAVDPTSAAPTDTSFTFTDPDGAYGGRFGLGRLYSLGREVRPFRRVLAATAAFPREVFAPPLGGAAGS